MGAGGGHSHEHEHSHAHGVSADAQGRWLAIGTATSFASTVAATDLIRIVERDRALAPYAAYRIAFALLILLNRSR